MRGLKYKKVAAELRVKQDCVHSIQHELRYIAIFHSAAGRADHNKLISRTPEASKRYSHVAILITKNSKNVDGRREIPKLGDAKGTLADLNRGRALVCSNEKELLIGCHLCRVRVCAANQRQTDCLG